MVKILSVSASGGFPMIKGLSPPPVGRGEGERP